MAVKFVCDFCPSECPDFYPNSGFRIKIDGAEHDMLMCVYSERRHVCDNCWNAHLRLFAEKLLSNPPKIGRSRPGHGGYNG